MKVRKSYDRKVRHEGDGIDIVADVQAAVSANVGERGASDSDVSSKQRIVQRSRKRASKSSNPKPEEKA